MSLITQPERFSEEAWELLLALLETPAGSRRPRLWPPPRAGGVAQL